MTTPSPRRQSNLLTRLGPGILVAATGVGAGDLAGASLAGSKLKLAILWAVVLGAFLKFALTEGLARYQLATGRTLLEGSLQSFGRMFRILFGVYLLLWSYFTGAALLNACGVTAHAIVPLKQLFAGTGISADFMARLTPTNDKIFYGTIHSIVALLLIQRGGFALFEKIMSLCIGVMFLTVVATALRLNPDPGAVTSGLLIPSIPDAGGEGIEWTVALMGGVGGTLTILCYGYWIRETDRTGPESLTDCRTDLAVGYIVTGLFGIAMVILGSQISGDGKGVQLLVNLGETLSSQLGPTARILFLCGAWGAIFSSLLGVWQSVPYLFADFCIRQRGAVGSSSDVDLTRTRAYRFYLLGLTFLSPIGLLTRFETAQKVYAVFGALFVPILAVILLRLNGRTQNQHGLPNRRFTTVILWAACLLFVGIGLLELRRKLGF